MALIYHQKEIFREEIDVVERDASAFLQSLVSLGGFAREYSHGVGKESGALLQLGIKIVECLFLEKHTGGKVSPSTLKRLYGYVSDNHKPRMVTLDILAQCVHR